MFEACLHEWGLDPEEISRNWTWAKFRLMSAAMAARQHQEFELKAKLAGAELR